MTWVKGIRECVGDRAKAMVKDKLFGADLFELVPDKEDESHTYVVKLRPGLTQFLEQLSTLYELYIQTHASRAYAQAILERIDPTGRFFKNRFVSRSDIPPHSLKSIHHLFPDADDDSMVPLHNRDPGSLRPLTPMMSRL